MTKTLASLLGLASLGVMGAAFGCGGSKAVVAAAHAHVSIPVRTYSFALKNGMSVILDEDHSAPIVSVNVSYKVGGRDDPPRRSGFAHLFEHLMFNGSRHVEAGDHTQLLAAAGAHDINATTTLDRTRYYETVPSDSLELAMWLESDRMGFLLDRLNQDGFEKERRVVKNERRERYETAPAGLVPGMLQAELYPEPHPYHRPAIGDPEDLDRAGIDDVRAYFRAHYMPSNATLVLVGDLEPNAARGMIEKYFEGLPSDAAPERAPAPALPPPGDRRIHVEANVEEPRLVVSWRTPPALTQVDVRIDVVIGMIASILDRWLVDERKLARDVQASYAAWQLGGIATLDITMQEGASHEEVLDVLDNALSDTPYARIGPDSMTAATNREASSLLFTLERTSERAEEYARYRELTGSPVFIEKHTELYNAIRARDVPEVKSVLLSRERRAVAFVTPSRSAPIGGRLVGGLEVSR